MRVEGGAFSSRLLAGTTAPAVRVRVLETLRWLGALDAVLQPRCRRSLADLDPEVRSALRLGLVEAMRLQTPPALATDGAVRLVRRLGKSSASGMVNAVLRKATGAWRDVLSDAPVALRFSHPRWLCDRWTSHFGEEAAIDSMASAQEPSLTWVWFFDDSERRAMEASGLGLEAHPWCPDCWRVEERVAELVEAVRMGRAYAQDPSSQMVAHVARAFVSEDSRVIDLCAAPGGKSALLARLAGPSSAIASDRSLTRVRLMRPPLARVKVDSVAVADAAHPPFAEGRWDLVLLDAPCTGTGTFRRHPELKWRLNRESIAEMAAVQRKLIEASLKLLAPGGVLLYATCSVEPEENETVVENLSAGFGIEGVESLLPDGVPAIGTSAGGVRILPNPSGDGFTMHAVRRL
jgi:16S rRNA (cytosine967-C5)-methyltransferase